MRRVTATEVLVFVLLSCVSTVVVQCQLDCDPCLARRDYVVKVISHGIQQDVYWANVRASAKQAALDMGVQLEFDLYDGEFDPKQMALDIENAAFREDPPNVLLVTVPSVEVHEAIHKAIHVANIPVFGFNSGYDTVEELGLLGFVAQEEILAGKAAAEEFWRISQEKQRAIGKKALFINHSNDNEAVRQRLLGFRNTLWEHTEHQMTVDELVVHLEDDSSTLRETIQKKAFGANGTCPYSFVLLAGSATTIPTVSAFAESGCKGNTSIGTFDTNAFVISSIVQGNIEFATSQQQYIQSVLPVLLGSIYATTQNKLTLPTSKVYLTGPSIINEYNIPRDSISICASDAFPICPNIYALDGETVSACDCIDRSQIRIGGVLHGVVNDNFWDPVFASARQAAKDMGVELDLERFDSDNFPLVYEKMASRIQSLCESGVHGIFITIPSDAVIEAIRICQLLNVPILSINSGGPESEEMGLLHHIGQSEYEAGYAAGMKLLSEDEQNIRITYYFNHEPGNSAVNERIRGFEDSIKYKLANGSNFTYGGVVDLAHDNKDKFILAAETAIDTEQQSLGGNEDWDGVAILITGAAQFENGLVELKEKHRKFKMGSFDITTQMLELIEQGELEFGVDQQPFLQGSLPVYLLTYMAYANEKLLNHAIQTGPAFVTEKPSIEKQICQDNFFKVCEVIPDEEFNYIASYMLIVGIIFVTITLLTGCIALFFIYNYRKKNIIIASQPPFLVMIIIGCMVSILSIITIGIQTDYRVLKEKSSGVFTTVENPDIRSVDLACMASPWLYSIGFVLTFSALLAKSYRVKLVVSNGEAMRRKKIGMKFVAPMLLKILFIESVLLITWQFVSPFQWERVPLREDPEKGYTLESVGQCTSTNGYYFLLVIFVYHILCLIYALVLCFQTKHIPTEFAESNWVSLAVLCIFQISVLAVPIAVLVQEDTTAFYFVLACAIFLQNYTVISLIFGPKLYRVIIGDDEVPLPQSSKHSQRSGRSSGRSSRRIRVSGLVDSTDDFVVGQQTSVKQHSDHCTSTESTNKIKDNKRRSSVDSAGSAMSFAMEEEEAQQQQPVIENPAYDEICSHCGVGRYIKNPKFTTMTNYNDESGSLIQANDKNAD